MRPISLAEFSGRFWATVAPVGAEIVGIQVLPSALSMTWIVLVLPCTFSEPIGLELRSATGDIYLHAQLFAALTYIGAALCMWVLRAWKIGELESLLMDKERRGDGLRNNGARPSQVPEISRHSRPSATVKITVNGFISWQKV